MEPIPSWSEERVRQWLQGLDAPLQQYPVSQWKLTGSDLLQLNCLDLERLGVHKLGHQELLLDAVEKLCSLTYGLNGESLKGLTEKLQALACTLHKGIQSRWKLNSYDGVSSSKLSVGVLQLVVELIVSAKGIFSLLNRYQFFQLSEYSSTMDIFTSCRHLGEIVHSDSRVYEKEKNIISVCRHLLSVCDDILKSSSEQLLSHTPELESVQLVPTTPGEALGIEITSTNSTIHYVTGSAVEPSSDVSLRILAGDEVIQVNDQIVVGWSRENLVKKLKENPDEVTLVLKRIPGSRKWENHTPEVNVSTVQGEETRSDSSSETSDEEVENPRNSIFERVAASVRSLSFRRAIQGPEGEQSVSVAQNESELPSEKHTDSLSVPHHNQSGRRSPLAGPGELEFGEGPRSPGETSSKRLGLRENNSSPDMVGSMGNKDNNKSSIKGQTTALSRRRVSCRELGHPDCDGWLWKKRRDSGVFVKHKWQRFWFILKGPALYWFFSQQDEKAEGFINISSYNIESAGEHKRKYVFKMYHPRFQNFFFAAENVSDMSKWINCLITAIQRHRKLHNKPSSEEECYSETESESERSPSPGRRNKKLNYNTYPRKKANKAPLPSPTTEGRKLTGPVDEMGQMLNNIKEGGVSLTGEEQPFTHDHFRRSFIKRCKNPVINEKVHMLRTLHSTLKAKEAELSQINKLLDDSDFSAAKYRQWKSRNEELLLEIEKLTVQKDCTVEETTDTSSPSEAVETVTMPTTEVQGAEAAFRLMLSDGEELVDAEPGDVRPRLSHESSPVTSPKLELNLGSLKDSINRELSGMAEMGETEHYFYI